MILLQRSLLLTCFQGVKLSFSFDLTFLLGFRVPLSDGFTWCEVEDAGEQVIGDRFFAGSDRVFAIELDGHGEGVVSFDDGPESISVV